MTWPIYNTLCVLSRHVGKACGPVLCKRTNPVMAVMQLNVQTNGLLPQTCSFHTSQTVLRNKWFTEPKEFLKFNDIVYPPQKEGEPPRPAEVVHQRTNIKYSVKKMFYLCLMVRGMTVDEALKQLQFNVREKGARIVTEVIKEAQEIAVKEHNVEYKSNLWIEHASTGKSTTVFGLRKHARRQYKPVRYRYMHLFIRLREGSPPKHYYKPKPDGNEKLQEYVQDLRNRRIIRSL